MASILFRGGLAPAIGMLGGGELGGEGVREGATGNESRIGVGNKRGFKGRLTSLSPRVLLFVQEWENPLQLWILANKQRQRRGE
jgi:hypothetical protein